MDKKKIDKKNKINYKLKRKIVQIIAAICTNAHVSGFITGKIYKGPIKQACVPGLNCYSCPGAVGGCPIGSLQAVISDIKYKFSFYVVGFLVLIGTIFGRLICGWVCPFGLVQELLYKIPIPKKDIFKNVKFLKYLKYIILAVFVIILPMFWVNDIGVGSPTFCKYICPAGTLEAGIPLVLLNEGLRSSIGFIYKWKLSILIITIILSIITFRPFCRFICPLGAIYGLFNPISLIQLDVDKNKCIKCKKCTRTCKLGVEAYKTPNSPECIRCAECIYECPTNALKFKVKTKDENMENNIGKDSDDRGINSRGIDLKGIKAKEIDIKKIF